MIMMSSGTYTIMQMPSTLCRYYTNETCVPSISTWASGFGTDLSQDSIQTLLNLIQYKLTH